MGAQPWLGTGWTRSRGQRSLDLGLLGSSTAEAKGPTPTDVRFHLENETGLLHWVLDFLRKPCKLFLN